MGRPPSQQVNAEINRLRRFLHDNLSKTDEEIMQELNIKRRRFYYYKEQIREQDKAAWLEITKESLESAALKVKNSLDYCIKISKDVADNSQDQRARIEAAKKVVECYMMFYKMLEKGPTSKSITVPISKLEQDGTDRRVESLGSNTVPTV
jgi:hypothetical protein